MDGLDVSVLIQILSLTAQTVAVEDVCRVGCNTRILAVVFNPDTASLLMKLGGANTTSWSALGGMVVCDAGGRSILDPELCEGPLRNAEMA